MKQKWFKRKLKGSLWSPFIISIFLFAMFIALPILTNIGNMTTTAVIAANPQMNATQVRTINNFSTNIFDNAPDIMLAVLYFVMLLATFIAASTESANPAVTLLLGLFFIVVAEMVSFGLADVAHAYISQTIYLNIAKHYSITTYIMEYLPYFNGLLTIAYIIFVISKKEVITEGIAGAGGGGGSIVSI